MVEDLNMQTRQVETGAVRLTKTVHKCEELLDEPLWKEEVEVKRVAVNRVMEVLLSIRHTGDTITVSVFEEVLVVEKRLMLKEELHIAKRRVEIHKPQHVTLRSGEATVEHISNRLQRSKQDHEKG